MDYIRKNLNLRPGQRVLQVAFGSGFKCNTGVWLCMNRAKKPSVVISDADGIIGEDGEKSKDN